MANVLTNLRRHHPGLAVLFATEMAERFSFYTMKALLTLYMVKHFGLSDAAAGQVYGIWGFAVWFTPVFGGLVADRWLGVIKTVFWGGVVFFFGHLLLGLTDFVPDSDVGLGSPTFLMFCFGLFVVACGNGLFKGNISVLVGILYDRDDRRALRDDAFQLFYIGINLGAALAPLSAPWIQERFGWGIAFGSAAAGIVVSFAIFSLGRRLLVDRAPTRSQPVSERLPLTPLQKRQLIAIFAVLVASALFWSVFFQDAYALTLFAERHTDLAAWGWSAPNFQFIEPAGIFILSPFFVLTWSLLRQKKWEPSTPAKMGIGMLFMAAAMLVMVVASGRVEAEPGLKISPWYLFSTYVLFTIGELCLSPMGLAFISKYAPPGRAGLLMGCWFASIGVGNYLTGLYGGFGLSLVGFYGLLVGIMVATALALFASLRTIHRLLHE